MKRSNPQFVRMVLVLAALLAMVLAGGAPEGLPW